jgi:two-component system cell cycle response regulator
MNRPTTSANATAASTEVRARLSAQLDDLEFHRAFEVEYRLDGAFRVEAEARRVGATDLVMRARLVQADMLQRKGQATTAAALATEANRWARENGPKSLLARSHLVLAAIFENVGDSASCLENALRAVELSDDDTPPRARGNYLARLADAFTLTGSFDSARQRYGEARAIFEEIGDVERQLNVLNNYAYCQALAGDVDEARTTSDRLRVLAAESQTALNPAFLDTIARVHIGREEYGPAEAAIETALKLLERDGDVQAVTPAELTLTLAEIQRRSGRFDQAQRTLDRCREVAVERALLGIEVDVMREQADLFAATGQFERAFQTYKIYHQRAVGLSSIQRESAARTRQALFETAEARQEAQRYWRQARTDELTRLPNRRFADEELPRRLAEVCDGTSLVVAIVDADHFKRINDTLSHEVGDRAICELARLIQDGVSSWGHERPASPAEPAAERPAEAAGAAVPDASAAGTPFVARLGGEEFLIVLPGVDEAAACELLRKIRADVDGHFWKPLLGGLPVTLSIGATVARPHDGQSDVLARADRCLYAAKKAGRNRVVVDFDTTR